MSKITRKELPPLELLQHLFEIDYDSPSGLRWKNPRSNRCKKGQTVGNKGPDGYWTVRIKTDKTSAYKVHRIIYFMTTKEDPSQYDIDHIYRNKDDNFQIRKATNSQNQGNKYVKSKVSCEVHSSRFKGVCWVKTHKKWKAYITLSRKTNFLGYFDTEIEAAKAYDLAACNCFKEFALLNRDLFPQHFH